MSLGVLGLLAAPAAAGALSAGGPQSGPALRSRQPQSLSPRRAIEALAAQTERVVCWVGAPPTRTVTIPADAESLTEVVSAWANAWDAAVLCTPDALFFHSPGTFRHVQPAHYDEQLVVQRVVPLLTSLSPALLARIPTTVSDLPPRPETDAALKGAPLASLEKEQPGFGAELRALLRGADAQAGETGPAGAPFFLHDAAAEHLYVRLTGVSLAICGVDREAMAVAFPISLSRYAIHNPLTIPAGPLRKALDRAAPSSVQIIRGELGALVKQGALIPKTSTSSELVVDRRLRRLPLSIGVPPEHQAKPLWPLLERGVGVECRELGPVRFFGPWMDAEREQRFRLISRWALAGGDLYSPLFTPYVARPHRLAPRELEWRARATIVAELRRLRAQGHAQVARIDPQTFLKRGWLMLSQRESLDVLYVAPPQPGASPALLGRCRFSLK